MLALSGQWIIGVYIPTQGHIDFANLDQFETHGGRGSTVRLHVATNIHGAGCSRKICRVALPDGVLLTFGAGGVICNRPIREAGMDFSLECAGATHDQRGRHMCTVFQGSV